MDVLSRPPSGRITSLSQTNELGIPIHGKHMERTRQTAISSSKTEKMRGRNQNWRENFKRLAETKAKHGSRVKKAKKVGKSKKQRKKSVARGKSERVTRYYLEDGKYEENENFESWADKLRRMWEKVGASQKSR